MSPVRNVSCQEVQGNNLLWLGEIEASCPESVPIPQGWVRCHLCCEALAKAKPPHRINLAFPSASRALSAPWSWSRVSGAFSAPLVLATNLVIFIIISLPGQHKAVAQFVEVNWIFTCNLNRKHFPDVFGSFPEGKSRPSEAGGGGPDKMRKSWYSIVLFEKRLLRSLGTSFPCRVIVVGERQTKRIYRIHPWKMNDLPPQPQNKVYLSRDASKAAYWPQWACRGRRKLCCSEPAMQGYTFSITQGKF